jgi:predicted DNA-binding protein (MmcQ/YjbR family)
MVSNKSFRDLALSLPDTVEQPHFEKTSFRVSKRIFATLSEAKNLVVIKLSEIDQSVFCSFDKSIIYPGKQ